MQRIEFLVNLEDLSLGIVPAREFLYEFSSHGIEIITVCREVTADYIWLVLLLHYAHGIHRSAMYAIIRSECPFYITFQIKTYHSTASIGCKDFLLAVGVYISTPQVMVHASVANICSPHDVALIVGGKDYSVIIRADNYIIIPPFGYTHFHHDIPFCVY